MHLNVRSLLHKIEELKFWLTEYKIDCLCLSESWLRDIITNDLIHIPGYKLTRWDRPGLGKSRGGGICVYSRSSLNVEEIKLPVTSNENIEIGGIKLGDSRKGSIYCVTVYRPPKGDIKTALNMLNSVTDYLSTLQKGERLIHGDFNINYANKNCKWANELKTWENAHGLNQIITSSTRTDNISSTMIDLSFTDIKYIKQSGVLEHTLSDHLPTFILKKKQRQPKRTCTTFTGRDYHQFSSALVRESLQETEPENHSQSSDPDEVWQGMQVRFLNAANTICPLKEFQIRHDKPPYLRGVIGSEMALRDKLYRIARSKKKQNSNVAWAKARRQKLKVRRLIRSSKRNYIGNELDKSARDSKKYWKTIVSFFSDTGKQHLNKVICPTTGANLFGMEAACLINDFFCDIGEQLANKIPDVEYSFAPKEANCVFDWSHQIGETEVLKRISELNIEKSSGIPQLGSKILKECLRHSVTDFTHLLNTCVRLGRFPMSWKQAIVVPIPKGNKILTLGNIRPISLLPYPGKILEQILHKQFYEYLEVNNLLCKEQAGFRRNYRTNDSMLDLCTYINKAFNKGRAVICVFIDMAKAFNSFAFNSFAFMLNFIIQN